MEDKLDDLITDYLAGALPKDACLQFEQRLAGDPELSARVTLERDLSAAIRASTPENQLRANLQSISKKYELPESLVDPSSESGKTWGGWILAAALLVATGLFFWNQNQAAKPTLTPALVPATELPIPAPAESLPKAPEKDKHSAEKIDQSIAAAFKPIPKLEGYIGTTVRSGGFRIRIREPRTGTILTTVSGSTTFRLTGKTEGRIPNGTIFNALIFSNNLHQFERMQPVVHQALDINSNGDFLFQKKLALSPGLYYLLIEEAQSGEWMTVEKFLVN